MIVSSHCLSRCLHGHELVGADPHGHVVGFDAVSVGGYRIDFSVQAGVGLSLDAVGLLEKLQGRSQPLHQGFETTLDILEDPVQVGKGLVFGGGEFGQFVDLFVPCSVGPALEFGIGAVESAGRILDFVDQFLEVGEIDIQYSHTKPRLSSGSVIRVCD